MGDPADDTYIVTGLVDAIQDWLSASIPGFFALKTAYGLGDTWTFTIANPDLTHVDDVIVGEIRDPRGAAAFMLRRIQALRIILNHSEISSLGLVKSLGYAADLSDYLSHLLRDDSQAHNPATAALWRTTTTLVERLVTHI